MSALRKLARHRIGHRKSPRVERVHPGYARKMSDIIVEVAQPMIDRAQDIEQFRMAISLAAMCWNLSFAPADERHAMMNEMLPKLVKPGEPTDEVRQIMEALIARKEALFPDDKRLITDYRVSGELGNIDIVVEYSPPEQE